MALMRETIAPITRVQIARYAGAVRDFNPIHVDEQFATQRAGLPSVVAHGPLVMTLALDRVLAVLGVRSVESFDVRFKSPVVPDKELEIVVEADGAVTITNQDGTVVASGRISGEGTHVGTGPPETD